ncbi:hypothetical protein A9Q96_16765 [Rhodobacterales bacterium 52_120_T64]|nr:hypothetical protein A9Q96_16765 [Rhodobacterales bacterium 52_120_T64]
MADLLRKPTETIGKVHNVTAESAGWGYVGVGLFRLKAGIMYATSIPARVAKHALLGMTKSLGFEYASKGIRVKALAPGYPSLFSA